MNEFRSAGGHVNVVQMLDCLPMGESLGIVYVRAIATVLVWNLLDTRSITRVRTNIQMRTNTRHHASLEFCPMDLAQVLPFLYGHFRVRTISVFRPKTITSQSTRHTVTLLSGDPNPTVRPPSKHAPNPLQPELTRALPPPTHRQHKSHAYS